MQDSNPISSQYLTIDSDAWQDLEMDTLLSRIFPGQPELRQGLQDFLTQLPCMPQDIVTRQESLQALMEDEQLRTGLAKSLLVWEKLFRVRSQSKTQGLLGTVQRLGELDRAVELLESLAPLQEQLILSGSQRLAEIGQRIRETRSNSLYLTLKKELPPLRDILKGARSVTIGLNLDSALRPVGAILLEMGSDYHGHPKKGLQRLFANGGSPLGELHEPPRKYAEVGMNQKVALDPELNGWGVNPKTIPIFREMERILGKASRKLSRELKAFDALNLDFWPQIYHEIALFTKVANFFQNGQKLGWRLCFPTILDIDANEFRVTEMAHPILEMVSSGPTPVANDVDMKRDGEIQIITGPNRGGKTVYLQSLGLAQIMAQAGLPICARYAEISPVQHIQTHFARLESTGNQSGRFGEEVSRLAKSLKSLQGPSLVLLNESLSSTGTQEASYIARDVLSFLRHNNHRGVFTTHFHDLACEADQINKKVLGESRVVSLISIVSEEQGTLQRTFRIRPGAPQGRSWARDLAGQFGLDFLNVSKEMETSEPRASRVVSTLG